MEIDFLGLNSSKYNLEQQNSKTPFIDTGGVEISLSLSTTSSLNFSEKKKWQLAAYDTNTMPSSSRSGSTVCSFAHNLQNNPHKTEHSSLLLVAPPLFRHSAAGFPYDLNDAATVNLRNMPQLYAARPNVFSDQQKAENSVYNAGSASPGAGGYTPTVAMARRATLARFLEKRLHRMNQARNCNLKRR